MVCAPYELHSIICSQFTGTLLDSAHELPTTSPTYTVLTRLRRTYPELPIVISTGKQYSSTAMLRKQLDLEHFHACHLNGNVIYAPSGKVLAKTSLSPNVVRTVFSKAMEKNASFFVYDHAIVWQLHRGAGDDGIWAQKLRGYGEDVREVDESVLNRIEVIKMAVCQDEAALKGAQSCSFFFLVFFKSQC